MPFLDYPQSFRSLVEQLRRLPSIGPRSAERIALWMLRSPHAHPKALAEAIEQATNLLKLCERCGFFTDQSLCLLCSDEDRAGKAICVLEHETDILPMERTEAFDGRYHALGGRLSPLDGIGPEELRISSLIERLQEEKPSEIILALSGDVEGEATAHYLAELISPFQIKITRLAQGLSARGGIEQTDRMTLAKALLDRRFYKKVV